jgi:hypothetical protein
LGISSKLSTNNFFISKLSKNSELRIEARNGARENISLFNDDEKYPEKVE